MYISRAPERFAEPRVIPEAGRAPVVAGAPGVVPSSRHRLLQHLERARQVPECNSRLRALGGRPVGPGPTVRHRPERAAVVARDAQAYQQVRLEPIVGGIATGDLDGRGGIRGPPELRENQALPGQEDRPPWRGHLLTDDPSGYKACFERGVTEVGCWAHARRKFHELWANHGSMLADASQQWLLQ